MFIVQYWQGWDLPDLPTPLKERGRIWSLRKTGSGSDTQEKLDTDPVYGNNIIDNTVSDGE